MPSFSLSSFINYSNDQVSTTDSVMSTAFRKDVKNAIILAGYPTKEEIDIIDTIEGLKMTNTAEAIPGFIASYMKDTDRDFDIPMADDKTCAASIVRRHVDEITKSGTSNMNGVEKEWVSTIAEHNEYYVKNRRKPFKK